MFKVIALIGAVAGGATYGIYHYGPNSCDGTCPLSRKSCCSDAPKPDPADCCASHEPCCGDSAGCPTGFVSAKTTNKIGEKAALCCVNPCLACVLVACEACDNCTAGCAACCDEANAKAAVAGPAAFAGVK